MEFYEEVVCDVEDKEDFVASMKELETTVAITKVANTVSEQTGEPVGSEEAEVQVLIVLMTMNRHYWQLTDRWFSRLSTKIAEIKNYSKRSSNRIINYFFWNRKFRV